MPINEEAYQAMLNVMDKPMDFRHLSESQRARIRALFNNIFMKI